MREEAKGEETQAHTGAQADETNSEVLTPVERRILDVERRRFKYQGSKEKAIMAAGFTPIAYYQRLNVMLDDERVRAAAPQLVSALRARRAAD